MTNNEVEATIGIVQKITCNLEQLYQKNYTKVNLITHTCNNHFFDKHSNNLKKIKKPLIKRVFLFNLIIHP